MPIMLYVYFIQGGKQRGQLPPPPNFRDQCSPFLPAAQRLGHAEVNRCSSSSWHDLWLNNGAFAFWFIGSFIICLFQLP